MVALGKALNCAHRGLSKLGQRAAESLLQDAEVSLKNP